MKEKKIISLNVEHIHFLVIRAGWLVTKIHAHYTFEQSVFQKEFITMNQVARQKAETSVERKFYKLMNNAKFGIDCRNNIDNCQFEVISDEIDKIAYIKNMQIYMTMNSIKMLLVMKEEIEATFNKKLLALDSNDSTFDARKYSLNRLRIQMLSIQ